MVSGGMRTTLLLSLCLFACDSKSPEPAPPARRAAAEPEKQVHADLEPFPAGAVVEGPVKQRFAVYAMPGGKTKLAKLAESLAGELPLAESREAQKAGQLSIETPSLTDYAPPNPEELQYFGKGLSAQEVEAVQKTPEVVALTMVSEPEDATDNHVALLKLTAELAEASGGLPWDEDTRQLFSREAWSSRIEHLPSDPKNLPFQFTVHVYREGELVRMVTLGLAKFGMPDIVMEDVPQNGAGAMNGLINALSVQMAVDAQIRTAGELSVDPDVVYGDDAPKGAAAVQLKLAVAEHNEGDPENRLVQIIFPGPADRLFERQLAAAETFAPSGDEVTMVDHDEELLAASAAAKKEFLAMRKQFADGIPDLDDLAVKAPFATTSGGTEWMWVSVTSWEGDTLRGVLDNEPHDVPSLQHGSKVEVRADAIFDYIYRKADGTQSGGKTVEIMLKRQ